MSLDILNYNVNFRPHFSYRFKVDFVANPSFGRFVKSVKLPSISINASDGRKRYGNTQVVLPFFEFGDQEMEITYVETDDMQVLNHLTNMMHWPNSPTKEKIIVTEYDDTMKNVIKITEYEIVLSEYNAPQWQSAGSTNALEINATYVVRSMKDITKQEYDMYNLPTYSPAIVLNQEMNVIGSSVDQGEGDDAWKKFLAKLYDAQTNPNVNKENSPSSSAPMPEGQQPQQPQGQSPVKPAPSPINSKKYSTMTDAEQRAYLREMLKNEISGKATNGHSRKEGNDNQVYKNSSDDKKANPTQMNYGYGNTYAKLKSLGADKLGEITFKANKDVVINGKTYKKGETVTFSNLTAANEALKDETLGSNGLVLDQASADKLNNLVLDNLAGEMQRKFKEKGIEDVIDNMNMNAQMGLTHMVYGGSGTLNSVTEGLAKNKQEAIDSLQANGGYLGVDYVEKHKNDKGSTYKSTNDKTQVTMTWNRLDYMSEQGKIIKKTDKNGNDISTPASKKQSQNQQVAKTNEKPLQKYTSSNSNRDADLAELRSKMQAAGVDTTNTSQVVDYLVKDGTITSSYKKDQNGLCATGTNLVAAVTSGATHMESTGNGKDQNLSCYGYKKVASGKGADQLNDMLKNGQLKEGDVINISYSDGSKYGHAVTVYKDSKGQLAFASDYVQKSSHGQSNASRVGEFYIQRKA